MKALEYIKADSVEVVIKELQAGDSVVIGGGLFLRNSPKEYKKIIDLEKLKLNYIKEVGNVIRIGATTTLREIETSEFMKVFCDGILSRCCEIICGVQHRNIATIGGTIGGRYGFSDLIPALVILESKLNFLDGSTSTLEEYLKEKKDKRIIREIEIKKIKGKASFKYMKNTVLDFSSINICALRTDEQYRVAVGARPGIGKRCPGVEQYLNVNKILDSERMLQYLYKDVVFGNNMKASKEYRETVCGSLLIEAVEEVKNEG